ncbi:GNAT family N-acetyltransferase [Butyricimonas paravirosa]|uniref:GNAT family N-acetyltransferase n=1 Tax=Butyricimonas paravirosa TaxID=1472417 RepID=UPI00210C1D76|nr:GNAT family N-acetyltransferase [Butyricimonas paravirosa]MCQ4873370.1 GNAT family N-acetyltransferase [Butyricimonas paravirosa]
MRYFIRQAIESDISALKQLFRQTLAVVNIEDYTSEEIADWVSCGDNDERWRELVNDYYMLVADDRLSDKLAGFSALSSQGYLNSMFVHVDYLDQGVASALLNRLEEWAMEQHIRVVTADVSITALTFFQKQGFVIEKEQLWKANKLLLKNYRMSKCL